MNPPVHNTPENSVRVGVAIGRRGSYHQESPVTVNNDLAARAKVYRQLAEAYEADPANALYLEQVRRDAEVAHRWLQAQNEKVQP